MADEAGSPEALAADAAASPELRVTGEPAPVANASGEEAPTSSASAPEAAENTNRGQRPSDPLDRARGIIHPVLGKGALELVRAGYDRDLTGLFEEAVYRLLETDHPGDLETLERGTSPQRCEDPPPI